MEVWTTVSTPYKVIVTSEFNPDWQAWDFGPIPVAPAGVPPYTISVLAIIDSVNPPGAVIEYPTFDADSKITGTATAVVPLANLRAHKEVV